jgi:predicted ATPase
MFALIFNSIVNTLRGDFVEARARADELVALAIEKRTVYWKAAGTLGKCLVDVNTGRSSDAATPFRSAIAAYRATGATLLAPLFLSELGSGFAQLRQFDEARRCIDEAMSMSDASGERWFIAETHRIAGEIELLAPERDATKAEGHFERALEVARAQQARSWELRAATSLARLWCDQGRRAEAHDLLAPVYGWFTEGFDTLDLKEAKVLLEELA